MVDRTTTTPLYNNDDDVLDQQLIKHLDSVCNDDGKKVQISIDSPSANNSSDNNNKLNTPVSNQSTGSAGDISSACSTAYPSPSPSADGVSAAPADPSLLSFLETLRYKNTFLEVGEKPASGFNVRRALSDPTGTLPGLFGLNADHLPPVSEENNDNSDGASTVYGMGAGMSPPVFENPLSGPAFAAPQYSLSDVANLINGTMLLVEQFRAAREAAVMKAVLDNAAAAVVTAVSAVTAGPVQVPATQQAAPAVIIPDEGEEDAQTTVMLRNIPNKYTQSSLLEVIAMKGFFGAYDFFYLPVDFKNGCNMGYAFINFVNHGVASKFMTAFKGYQLPAVKSVKVCDVCWARVQGRERNIEHYRNSPVNDIPNMEYRPLLFDASGKILPFPAPDQNVPRRPPASIAAVSSQLLDGDACPLTKKATIGANSHMYSFGTENVPAALASIPSSLLSPATVRDLWTEQLRASAAELRNKVFIGGLLATTSSETLRSYFAQYGEVIDASVVIDKKTGLGRGFGFCTFASAAVTEEVLRRKHWIDGQSVGVRIYTAGSSSTPL